MQTETLRAKCAEGVSTKQYENVVAVGLGCALVGFGTEVVVESNTSWMGGICGFSPTCAAGRLPARLGWPVHLENGRHGSREKKFRPRIEIPI